MAAGPRRCGRLTLTIVPVDPQIRPVLELLAAVEVPEPTEAEVESLRVGYAMLCSMLGAGAPDVSVTDHAAETSSGAIPLRRYSAPGTSGVRPALVWFHSGGWVIGDLDSQDGLCRDLCAASGWTVVSVDYRRAPEHRFPAAHDDALAAVTWISAHAADLDLDPARIALGGDSAGATLATASARKLRDLGDTSGVAPPVAQVLLYPVTDTAHGGTTRSWIDNAEGYLLTAGVMEFFLDAYLPDHADRLSPDVSPLRAEDLGGLPPALVLTAEHDPLRDEGDAYARRLVEAGVPTEHDCVAGAVHLFAQMSGTDVGRRAVARIADFLRGTA